MLPYPIGVLSLVACQICDNHGYFARVCPQHDNFAYPVDNMITLFAITSVCALFDSNWVIDFNATHHMALNAFVFSSHHLLFSLVTTIMVFIHFFLFGTLSLDAITTNALHISFVVVRCLNLS